MNFTQQLQKDLNISNIHFYQTFNSKQNVYKHKYIVNNKSFNFILINYYILNEINSTQLKQNVYNIIKETICKQLTS